MDYIFLEKKSLYHKCMANLHTVKDAKILDRKETYDWLSLNPLALGNNRSQRRSKNIFRGIEIGIGPIWEMNSLSFILS